MAVPSRQHQTLLADSPYLLRLTDAGAPLPVPGHPIAGMDGAMALMLPPQSFRPSQPSRIGVMETMVGAIADEQGMSPPTWDLAGQFQLAPIRVGNSILDHTEQQRALESFVRYYLDENKRRARAQDALIRMEFHDFYADEHWFVAPLGVPLGERDVARPTIERYSLRLRGLAPTTRVDVPADTVTESVLADPAPAIEGVCPDASHTP